MNCSEKSHEPDLKTHIKFNFVNGDEMYYHYVIKQ